ncbi:MAG TPA: radical SAM protein [Xanthobacteraceae bacterium]|nr:radical SAM protein [Bradyrhizobium sp.]HKS61281.1 radical SAM protein [Xanthobacteraceae bacterium]
MNVLLLSMPDSFEHMPTVAVRMPNGGLASIAGNVDPHHKVAIADLILVQKTVRATLERLVREIKPDVVGLSIMTFQRKTALQIIELVRSLSPGVRIVVGGYDPSLATAAYMKEGSGVDFVVCGEGDVTFRELLRALEGGKNDFASINGLVWRDGDTWQRNLPRRVHTLEGDEIRLPNRGARVLDGYAMMGRQVDVIETSRGCTFDCSFCSIIEMRGRNFHTYSFDRVIADIADAKAHGARTIFIIDDNITLNIERFEAFCHAIIEAGHNDIDYTIQAMTSAIANHGDKLAPLMRKAGFRYVFLGIENIVEDNLDFLVASAKNRLRKNGRRIGNASLRAIEAIRQNGMYVVGGLIVGNPNDTLDSVRANLQFARKYVDWPYIQHPTPYPGTPMTKDFRERNLIKNENLEQYDGTTAVVASEHLEPEEIEYERWRAERWMKVRHLPPMVAHDPWFVLRNWWGMLSFTFRGSSVKSVLGLESDREVFARYRAIRSAERQYL